MNEPQTPSPRQRLQALLAIPDSDRTDEEWDELNELEISMAPGNRIGAPMPGTVQPGRRNNNNGGPKSGMPKNPNGGAQKQGKPRPPRPQSQQGKPGPAQQPKPANAAAAPAVATEDGAAAKKPARKFHKRTPKPKTPQSGNAPATDAPPQGD